jgi:hypothetical protein
VRGQERAGRAVSLFLALGRHYGLSRPSKCGSVCERLKGAQVFDGVEAKMFLRGIGAGLLALSMTAGVATAATIFSDDFENPVNTMDWQVYEDFGNWSTTSGSGIEIQTTGTVGGVSARSGDQYVELDSDNERGGLPGQPKNSSMTTTLSLVAGSYVVEWYYQPRTNTAGDNIISVYLAGASEGLFDNALGSMDSVRSLINNWVKVSYSFTVDGLDNLYALTFRAEGISNELGGFIDDVSVSVAPVPVPAAGFLLIGALGGLVALRRRKAAA